MPLEGGWGLGHDQIRIYKNILAALRKMAWTSIFNS